MSNTFNLPTISNDKTYTKTERLHIALSYYHQELQMHTQNPPTAPKPIILQFAKTYDVNETTLQSHINNRLQKTYEEVNQESQLLTSDEEKVLVERLLFLDDFNIPTSKSQLYELAHTVLHRRLPGRTMGVNWIYRFLKRHHECKYILVKTIATNRANAVTWDMMDDFFAKVRNFLQN